MTQFDFPQDGEHAYPSNIEARRTAIINSRDILGVTTEDNVSMGVTIDNTHKTAVVTVNSGDVLIDGAILMIDSPLTFNVDWNHIEFGNADVLYFGLVAVSNRTNFPVERASGLNGIIDFKLFFPSDLTDYEFNNAVPPESVRLAVIIETNKFYFNLFYQSLIPHDPGSIYFQPVDTLIYDMSVIGDLTNGIETSVLRHEDNLTAVISSSLVGGGDGLITLNTDVHDSGNLVLHGKFFAPVRGATELDVFQIALALNWPLTSSSQQSIYSDGEFLDNTGQLSNIIHLSYLYPAQWNMCSFKLVFSRMRNYIFVNGDVLFSHIGIDYQGIPVDPGDTDVVKQRIYGTVYTGNGEGKSVSQVTIANEIGGYVFAGDSELSYHVD